MTLDNDNSRLVDSFRLYKLMIPKKKTSRDKKERFWNKKHNKLGI